MLKPYPFRHLRYFLSVYLLFIFIFFLFRVLLLLTNTHEITGIPAFSRLVFSSFLIGLNFDTVITCYFLFLPVLLITLMKFVSPGKKWMYPVVYYYFAVVSLPLFFICSSDLPYYHHYSSRISAAVFNWTDSPGFVLRMIIEEPRFFIYFFVFLLFYAGFLVALKFIHRKIFKVELKKTISSRRYYLLLFPITILLLGLVFIGARGRLAMKTPIKPGAAYFSDYNFLNQLALNPVYTFMVSWFDSMDQRNHLVHLMDDNTAIANVRRLLEIPSRGLSSPVARNIRPETPPLRANVVLVIMESMSGEWMKHFQNPEELTPNLDSLAHHCLFFENTYSSGIHTFNGVYSVLFGYPSLLHQHPLNLTIIPQYSGLARTLKENGYQTIYFTTHDELFDNISGFLKSNGIEQIISQKDYPSEKVLSTLGVPDDYMFEYSIPVLNQLHEDGMPFLSVFMTASLHEPYIIPKDCPFKPKSKDVISREAEYADWSIGRFLKMASRQAWYDSTIFVFIGDHGAFVQEGMYDMQLSMQHTPLFIFAPKLVSPGVCSQMGGQIDVFPTIMGILRLRYLNNTMGTDLLKEKRPCIYFTADDRIGCLGKDYFFIHRMVDGAEFLHHYRDHDLKNYLSDHTTTADSLRNYAFSMLQTTQWIITHKKTFIGLK
jgi:phosphoglycerol transferase MdoB-like AlkP superfamily enzyme